jgi:formate-dependent nitrite reductase membrane component NrfD
MKVFFQIVAWLGVLIIALAISITLDVGGFNVDMYGFGLMVAAIICLVGVYLLLLGGFKSRSHFLWIITLIAGIAYLVVLPRVWMPHNKIGCSVGWLDWRLVVISAFPGIVCVVGGVFMRWHILKHRHTPIQALEDK